MEERGLIKRISSKEVASFIKAEPISKSGS